MLTVEDIKAEFWINVYEGHSYSYIPHSNLILAIIASASTPFKLLYRIHVRVK